MDDVVQCPGCGQKNRLPPIESGQKAVCGRCKAPLAGGGEPIDVTDATFVSTISRGKHIVDFWAAWCGPCRMIAPVLEEIAAERSDVRVAKLNVDQNPRTAERFNVQGIPLLVFFSDGVERGRITGAVPKTRIEAGIREYLS